ncbi:hypothetical protein N9B82_06510 [Saprospiraceae bacterium]|nr:hypothetical protein [Saprospiraceae bacterium]
MILLALTPMLLLQSCKSESETKKTTVVKEVKSQIVSSISLEKQWDSPSEFTTSESVLRDSKGKYYYVSCIGNVPPTAVDGDGFISKMDLAGKVLDKNWATGLSAPKGMGQDAENLYVTDVADFVVISKATGKETARIAVEGAIFLNDVHVSPEGDVYFSDSAQNKIHKFSNGKVTIWLNSEKLGKPNGIHIKENQMYVSSGEGFVLEIDRKSKAIEQKAEGIFSGDGIEPWKDGFIISSWMGEIWFADSNWKTTKLIDSKEEKLNTADIAINQSTGQLLVPTFFDNRVMCYSIK